MTPCVHLDGNREKGVHRECSYTATTGGVLHGRQMVLLVTIGLHALVIAVLMTMKVMPDKIFDGHMKLDALLPDKPVEPPPPQLPVSNPLRSSVPYVPEIPVPVPTLPEESVPTPTQIQLDTDRWRLRRKWSVPVRVRRLLPPHFSTAPCVPRMTRTYLKIDKRLTRA